MNTACVLMLLPLLCGNGASLGIPLKPDPPIAVDGALGDWANVPGSTEVASRGHVVWGEGNWTGPRDMSGTIHLAWRQEYLFVAADVVDDVLSQSQRGSNLWKGDHIEVYIDAAPDVDPSREVMGEGQYQFGISPGNFQNTGDPFTDCKPEAVCFRPVGFQTRGIQAAASRTDQGWTIETAIPWELLGITPEQGVPLRIEVTLSDTDVSEAQQETMLAMAAEPWSRNRSRMLFAGLAGTDGVPAVQSGQVVLFDELRLQQGEAESFPVEIDSLPGERIPVMSLDAWLDNKTVAGHTPSLRIAVNGKKVPGNRLLNRPSRVKARSGKVYSMYAGDRFTTYYTPRPHEARIHHYYALLGGLDPCAFEIDLSGFLKQGANTITIEHAAADTVQQELVAQNARVSLRLPPAPGEKAGPPTGPLPIVEPRAVLKTVYDVQHQGDAITVRVNGQAFTVTSGFHVAANAAEGFARERQVEALDEVILVRDVLTNTGEQHLGIVHRHEFDTADGKHRLWLAGLEQSGLSGKSASPSNPTTYVGGEKGGIGLLPLDDVFRVHASNYAGGGKAGMTDANLVLPPGQAYTCQWLIVPAESGGYWDFLNAARRHIGANFVIDGGFAFLRADHLTQPWSDEQITGFIRLKDAHYVCAGIGRPAHKGRIPHGTAFQKVHHTWRREGLARWRALVPESEYLVYFHCFIDVTDEGPEQFSDARILRPDGTQADYGKPHLKLFFPMHENSYGPAVAGNIDAIFEECGADGVYWDEHERSRVDYHFGEPWDQRSGDIDPKTFEVTRLKSSVTLLTEAWRLDQARRVMARGPLIGNGPPVTRAMAALHFPCFVETGSITNCVRSHLHSPIALGDHLTERSETDAYRTMLDALDYGCVYHWYYDLLVIPTHHHLTRYMYPITPVELHEGYIIGEERIITNRSGMFGWGDASRHEVHVFNDEGVEQPRFDAPLVEKDGKTYTELRIGEEWSAAIVRKAAVTEDGE